VEDVQQAAQDLLRGGEPLYLLQTGLVGGRAGHNLAAADLQVAKRQQRFAIEPVLPQRLEGIGRLAVAGRGLLGVTLRSKDAAQVAQRLSRPLFVPHAGEDRQGLPDQRGGLLVLPQGAVDQADVDHHLGGHVALAGGGVGLLRLPEQIGGCLVVVLVKQPDTFFL